MMRTSPEGIHLIEQFEGFIPHIYYDSVGVATIGFGTTSADVSPLPTTVTRAQAEQILKEHLAHKYEPAVNALGNHLNQNQFDALVSLAYNCGPGAMQWEIGRDVKAGQMREAADDFLRYVYAGGRVLQGLVNRRKVERLLFLKPDYKIDKYDIFPNEILINHLNERQVVLHVDGALEHPEKYRAYMKQILYPQLKKLRDRIWEVAHWSKPPAWADDRNLGKRWQELNNRMKKIASLK